MTEWQCIRIKVTIWLRNGLNTTCEHYRNKIQMKECIIFSQLYILLVIFTLRFCILLPSSNTYTHAVYWQTQQWQLHWSRSCWYNWKKKENNRISQPFTAFMPILVTNSPIVRWDQPLNNICTTHISMWHKISVFVKIQSWAAVLLPK